MDQVDCPRSGVSPDKLTFLAAMEVATSQGRWDMCIFLYEKSRCVHGTLARPPEAGHEAFHF